MLRSALLTGIFATGLVASGSAWAASTNNAAGSGSDTPMMNNETGSGAAMQNGTMQNGAMQPTSPSANGGALKDSAEANKMKNMNQQNSNQ